MSEGWQEVAYRLSQLTWQRLAHSQQQAAKRTQISPPFPHPTRSSLSPPAPGSTRQSHPSFRLKKTRAPRSAYVGLPGKSRLASLGAWSRDST